MTMTNREKYITKRDEYDLMMAIKANIEHGHHCPIKAVSGQYEYSMCLKYSYICSSCCQDWLNEEAKP